MMYSKEYQCRNNKVDKPEKVSHQRGSLRQRDRGKISASVRKEVEKRSGDCCERCGRHKSAGSKTKRQPTILCASAGRLRTPQHVITSQTTAEKAETG